MTDLYETIRRWAFCVFSPERVPTAPCSCPRWVSETMVRDFDWLLEQEAKRKDREINNPRAKAQRRKGKRQ